MGLHANFIKPEDLDRTKLSETIFSSILSSSVYLKQYDELDKCLDGHYSVLDGKDENDLKSSMANFSTVLNSIEPLNAENIKMPKNGSIVVHGESNNYRIQEGLIKIGDPNDERAALGIGISTLNGKRTMHLAFRGTETDLNKGTWKYFLKDYPNMRRHYDFFKPFLGRIMELADECGCEEIHVAGHSLGGAMVQRFLDEHPNDHRIKGFAFGNPCSSHILQPVIDGIDRATDSTKEVINGLKVNNFLRVGMQSCVKIANASLTTATVVVGGTIKGVINLIDSLNHDTIPTPFDIDKRLTIINHIDDDIPIAGVFLYRQNGNICLISDDNMEGGLMKNHKMFNYTNSLFKIAKDNGINLSTNPQLSETSKLYNNEAVNTHPTEKVNIISKRGYILGLNVPKMKNVLS